ncbi:hypothetical protein PG994_011579 [Apiospora phragmitis]|uniref:Uncharacterized protein n=1 Tax=Apiospora phragmitis TaxID=2905665 RepID=A0ABR1TVV0_9PEZI
MSLLKMSPGVYIVAIPPSMEHCFEDMCENFAGAWNHLPAGQAGGALVQESSTDPDSHYPGSNPGSRSPPPHESTQCRGLFVTYTFNRRAGGPPRPGPPSARPDPCTPKGHVVVMMPAVPPKNIPPPGPRPSGFQCHVVIVIPGEDEEGGPGNRPPPPPRPDPCIPKGHSVATNASEPPRSPRSTSPQRSTTEQNTFETGSSATPSSSGMPSTTTTAWEAAAPAPEAGQSSAVECVFCGDRFKMPG